MGVLTEEGIVDTRSDGEPDSSRGSQRWATLVASDDDDMVWCATTAPETANRRAAAETQLWRAMTAIGTADRPEAKKSTGPAKAGPPTPPGAGSFSTASSTLSSELRRAAQDPSAVGGQGVPRWGCPGPGRVSIACRNIWHGALTSG